MDWNRVKRIKTLAISVASFTDAWIETQKADACLWERMSHLLQMRGLKHIYLSGARGRPCRIFYRCVDWNLSVSISQKEKGCRIFYRCVDWNTHEERKDLAKKGSHLLQMRGLKPVHMDRYTDFLRRIFYRCVDWNSDLLFFWPLYSVASFTDAWIETRYVNHLGKTLSCRIFYRCVDWNNMLQK